MNGFRLMDPQPILLGELFLDGCWSSILEWADGRVTLTRLAVS